MTSEEARSDKPIVEPVKRALYFGCRGAHEAGHFLQEGRKTIWDPPPECAFWSLGLMDSGLLKNGRHPDVEDGKVWWTCGGRGQAGLWFALVRQIRLA